MFLLIFKSNMLKFNDSSAATITSDSLVVIMYKAIVPGLFIKNSNSTILNSSRVLPTFLLVHSRTCHHSTHTPQETNDCIMADNNTNAVSMATNNIINHQPAHRGKCIMVDNEKKKAAMKKKTSAKEDGSSNGDF